MLSPEQIETYHRDGYLGVENVLSEAEVEELRQVTDEFVEKSRRVIESDVVFDLEPGHTPDEPKLRRLKSPIKVHDVYRQTIQHEEYNCHVYRRSDGLAVVVAADMEYPARVAFVFGNKLMQDFAEANP